MALFKRMSRQRESSEPDAFPLSVQGGDTLKERFRTRGTLARFTPISEQQQSYTNLTLQGSLSLW